MAIYALCVVIAVPIFAAFGIIALPIYTGVQFIREKLPSKYCCDTARFFCGVFLAIVGIPFLYLGVAFYGVFLMLRFIVIVLCCNKCTCSSETIWSQ